MKPTKITKTKSVKGGISMKKMGTAKTKSVKGGAMIAKEANVTGKAKKEKDMKSLLLEALSLLEDKKTNPVHKSITKTREKKRR